MNRSITINGKTASLSGRELKVGMRAPDILVVGTDLNPVRLSHFPGKVKVITSFFSLDTPVCDLQVKSFNQRAAGLSEDVVVLAISKDMPFAQQRFCSANQITRVQVLSDYKYSYFGSNYGVLIEGSNLLARATFIVDKNNIIRFMRIVSELTQQPDYNEVLDRLAEILEKPLLRPDLKAEAHALPIPKGSLALNPAEISERLSKLKGWDCPDDRQLVKEYKFPGYLDARQFLDNYSLIADEQNHHPNLDLSYNRVKVTLTTHAANGLTENDFLLAGLADELVV